MQWVATFLGATQILTVCDCTDLNIAFPSDGTTPGTESAASWNSHRPAWTGRDAKADTTICSWFLFFGFFSNCSAGYANLASGYLSTYYGTDNKWYMSADFSYGDSNGASGCNATLGGEVVFNGGGAPMDCGTPGEVTPTFSLTIPLTAYFGFPCSFIQCNPPTSVLIEGNPQ